MEKQVLEAEKAAALAQVSLLQAAHEAAKPTEEIVTATLKR